ncbi:MAG: hypothetical protein ABWZ82_01610, partial [Candidatus Limnocylindrales bacterium]
MSWSRWSRRVFALLPASLALVAVLLGGSASVLAQDPAASPSPSALPALPGPAPECTPEVEPNEQPDQAPVLAGPICLTGTLPALRDQDLVLWDVAPADGLTTWRITVVGIPTTFTSVHMFVVTSEPGVFPVQATALDRIDSDAYSDTPGVASGYALPAGRYLLGVSRGDPAAGPPAPPGEYKVTFEREQVLPPDGDREPNDDAASATPAGGPIDLVGAVDGGPDLYRWTLDATDASRRHRIDLQVVPGDHLDMRLLDAQGADLARASSARDGLTHIHDLSLPAGDYLIELSTGSGGAHGYRLTTALVEYTAADAEPNDVTMRALPIAMGDEVTGRLAGVRDFDRYTFEVPQTLVASQVDV